MADDEYNKKLESLQQYIPFLNNMITQLKDPSRKNREQQLNKMESLHAMITDKKKKLKLETLTKCEDVIIKLYGKVSHKQSPLPAETPTSPSPPRDIQCTKPVVIPTEKVTTPSTSVFQRLGQHYFPKVDVYSSAGESLQRKFIEKETRSEKESVFNRLGSRFTDMSKPPISIADLKTLEDDVQEKLISNASLTQLTDLKKQLTQQIQLEEKFISREPKISLETINTTVRNSTVLTKKVIQPPDKPKVKEKAVSPVKISVLTPGKINISKCQIDATNPVKEVIIPTQPVAKPKQSPVNFNIKTVKPAKVLKEPDSIFGSLLSSIDNKILEGKKKDKKDERRNSINAKDEKKLSESAKELKSSKSNEILKETKEERESLSVIKVEKKEPVDRKIETEKKKDSNEHKTDKKIVIKPEITEKNKKARERSLSADKKEQIKRDIKTVDIKEPKPCENKSKVDIVPKLESNEKSDSTLKKELAVSEKDDKLSLNIAAKDVNLKNSTQFKRLADKYNPKPRKPSVDTIEVEKDVFNKIEESMKLSPVKIPFIDTPVHSVPTPDPPQQCNLKHLEFYEPLSDSKPVDPIIENIINNPNTTTLINNVVSQLQIQPNISVHRQHPMISPRDNDFISDSFVTNFCNNPVGNVNFNRNAALLPTPPQIRPKMFQNNIPRPQSIINQENFNVRNQFSSRNPQFMGQNNQFPHANQNNRQFSSFHQRNDPMFQQQNFNQMQFDMNHIQNLDYYPPNAPLPVNSFNNQTVPPLLSPQNEHSHFYGEQIPRDPREAAQFIPRPNVQHSIELFGNQDRDMRINDNRTPWGREGPRDNRVSRDPRNYREYREMRERDPRDNDVREQKGQNDSRDTRDPRERSRDPRDYKERDPRHNRDSRENDYRDFTRERSRTRERSEAPEGRQSRFDSRFDRVYSTSKRSRSGSQCKKESFISPLDSLYAGGDNKTGKGYGVQSFRIPKIKKEDGESRDSNNEDAATSDMEMDDNVNNVSENTSNIENLKEKDITSKVEPEPIKEPEKVIEQEINKVVSEENVIENEPPVGHDTETSENKVVESEKLLIKKTEAEEEDPSTTEKNILFKFFANLLDTENKEKKKGALLSIISTFSDSIGEKQIQRITSIIENQDDGEESKVPEEKLEPIQQNVEEIPVEDAKEEEPSKPDEKEPEMKTKQQKRPAKKRSRKPSIASSLKDESENCDKDEIKDVVESVGERIKSRKRVPSTPSKARKCRTELDMLHEDIQDMFIRDGVLTATGKRMCRMLKDDPDALSATKPTEEIKKPRNKPGPKPKKSHENIPDAHLKTMSNVRVLISKIPDEICTNEDNKRRSLRRSVKKACYVYNENDEDTKVPKAESSVVDEKSISKEESQMGEEETETESVNDIEKDKLPEGKKIMKRKKTRSWASGFINKKKKRKLQDEQSDPENDPDDSDDTDRSFVEPDKNYFIVNTKLKCKLCSFSGRFLTNHYKLIHPEHEVLNARISPGAAEEAILDSLKNLDKYESQCMNRHTGKFDYSCRVCNFKTNALPSGFYDHITTHTGEFRHKCGICSFSSCNGNGLLKHLESIHPEKEKNIIREQFNSSIVFGFICGECNYFQLNRKSVGEHIKIYHLSDPKIYKINLSSIPIIQDKNETTTDTVNESSLAEIDSDDESLIKKRKNDSSPEKSSKLETTKKIKLKTNFDIEDENVEDIKASIDALLSENEDETKKITEKLEIITYKPAPASRKRAAKEKAATKFKAQLDNNIYNTTIDSEIVVKETKAKKDESKTSEVTKQSEELTKKQVKKNEKQIKKNEKQAKKIEKQMKKNEKQAKNCEKQTESNNENSKVIEEDAQKEEKPKIPLPTKKEIEMNVFTCKTDIQEENKMIEKERMQLMEELNKAVGSRNTLNFVEKLSNRLMNEKETSLINDLNKRIELVITEQSDDECDVECPEMPILEMEKSFPTVMHAKKPTLETHLPSTSTNLDVSLKNNRYMNGILEKLQGVLNTNVSDDTDNNSNVSNNDNDYDSDGPPPLTHVNKIIVTPSDESTKTLNGGFIKVIKNTESLTYSCLVPPCVFSTDNKDTFQLHCKEEHRWVTSTTKCKTCGKEIVDKPILEKLFHHLLHEHTDFFNISPKTVIRMRRLSGDLLSINEINDQFLNSTDEPNFIKIGLVESLSTSEKNQKDEGKITSEAGLPKISLVESLSTSKQTEDNITSEPSSIKIGLVESLSTSKNVGETNYKITDHFGDTTTNMETEPTQETEIVSMAQLEKADDNPFSFQISDVVSLATDQPHPPPLIKEKAQPPPLTPIVAKPHIIVKEGKLTAAELRLPKKAPKSMDKFIDRCSDLYKCPIYYCMFTTNFKEYLERHLLAHKEDPQTMIPCVYCNMKTPIAHVPMHIDIRHAHCRFSCAYCLYRAVVREYVRLHQDAEHPERHYSIIALPNHKQSKRFSVADAKIKPELLCEPFKCCNLKFLFVNEFNSHLLDKHNPDEKLHCYYKHCRASVVVSKMVQHWNIAHLVCIYQCGYCKYSCNKLPVLHIHLACKHPGSSPDIIIRQGFSSSDYVSQLKQLKHIFTIPDSKIVKTASSESNEARTPEKINSVYQSESTKKFSIVASSPPKNLILNKLVAASTNLLIPKQTKDVNVIQNQNTSAISMVNVPSLSILTSDNDSRSDAPSPNVHDIIEPVEHINIDASIASPKSIESSFVDNEIDPLSLDTDLEVTKSNATVSIPQDDSDTIQTPEKTKEPIKTGLKGLDLYVCRCKASFSDSVNLKKHITESEQCKKEDIKPYECAHCGKTTKTIHNLLEHIQYHGILRFSCSLCNEKFPAIFQVRIHMKNRHNCLKCTVTPINSQSSDEFIVRPKTSQPPEKPKETPLEEGNPINAEDLIFSPNQIEKIPMRSIFSVALKCAFCTYSTKVRTNFVRHLQFHSQERAVSDTAPVNPVPCLDKNEKMFDKMTNLAASSNTGRMGANKAEKVEKEDNEKIPDFIPTHCRYVCCAVGCSYLCPEEGNLRHHLIALHGGESTFTCTHCKRTLTPTDADNLMKHFKLHGLHLYKCGYCKFVHNLKHKVERHVSDTHMDMPNKIIKIRSLDAEPLLDVEQVVLPAQIINKPNKPWRCCMCKSRSNTLEDIQSHVLHKHEIDSQFKCALCNYKTNIEDTFEKHFEEVHAGQEIDIIHVYRKVEDGPKTSEEVFDTTPLWQRDRPRVRHIRGILFDDIAPSATLKSPKKTNKPSYATATPSTSTASTSSASYNLDIAIAAVANGTADILKTEKFNTSENTIETINREFKDVAKIEPDLTIMAIAEDTKVTAAAAPGVIVIEDDDDEVVESDSKKIKLTGASKIAIDNEAFVVDVMTSYSDSAFSANHLKTVFGKFGFPINKQFKCPCCDNFKTKQIVNFIYHILKEKKTSRYKCKLCAEVCITYDYILNHVKRHRSPIDLSCIETLSVNLKLPIWIQMVIYQQSSLILKRFPFTDNKECIGGCYPCNFCKKSFFLDTELYEHQLIHWSKKPYSCNSCDYGTFWFKNMENHYKIIHPKIQMSYSRSPTIDEIILETNKEILKRYSISEKEFNLNKINSEIKILESESEPEAVIINDDDSSDLDLVIDEMPELSPVVVSKTEIVESGSRNDSVYFCLRCAVMSNCKLEIRNHISTVHKKQVPFRCHSKDADYIQVECSICKMVSDEYEVRKHHLTEHADKEYKPVVYRCKICQEPFMNIGSVRVHYKWKHKNQDTKAKIPPLAFGSQVAKSVPKKKGKKLYQCIMCNYSTICSSTGNMRVHFKTHFRPYKCGVCFKVFKTNFSAQCHLKKEHMGELDNIIVDNEKEHECLEKLAKIFSMAVPVDENNQKITQNTARKSTAKPSKTAPVEFSFYGCEPEKVDLKKIMTTVEVNKVSMTMTAEQLGNIFNLFPHVEVNDCNISVNMMSLFDS